MIEYNEKKAVQNEEPDIKPRKLFRRYRPKYLKKPAKRKSLRALTCFALIFAALMASVAGTYAKYISDPVTVEPFSIQAAQFACKVEDFDFSEIDKSKYDLKDTDIIVAAFKVSNFDGDKTSEVDLSVDIDFYLQGTYNYEMQMTPDSSPAGYSIKFRDSNDNDTKTVGNNVTYVNGLGNNLILKVGKLENNAFEPVNISNTPNKVKTVSVPAYDEGFTLNDNAEAPWIPMALSVTYDHTNDWKDKFRIPAGDNNTYVAIIAINTEVYSEGSKLNYTGPDLNLQGLAGGNNLKVTVNQAKASVQGG